MPSYPFGYLPSNTLLRFNGGEVAPLDTIDDARAWIAQYIHVDGFMYPPLVRRGTEKGELVPNTERPRHLYRLPASHELRLDDGALAADRHRRDATVVIQLLGYLHETWPQFHDWWFDARVPISKRSLYAGWEDVAEDFLSKTYHAWRQLADRDKKRLLSTLWMFNRSPSYEWDWERFMVEYMIVDACYKTGRDAGRLTKCNHDARIRHMCDVYGIPRNDDLTKEFTRLRNDLFHEILWDGGQPSTAQGNAYMMHLHLRHLNRRLILATLGYGNTFAQSPWWNGGNFLFAKA